MLSGQSDQQEDSVRKPTWRRSSGLEGAKRWTNRSSTGAHARHHTGHRGCRRHQPRADSLLAGRVRRRLRRSPATGQRPRLCMTSISFLLNPRISMITEFPSPYSCEVARDGSSARGGPWNEHTLLSQPRVSPIIGAKRNSTIPDLWSAILTLGVKIPQACDPVTSSRRCVASSSTRHDRYG